MSDDVTFSARQWAHITQILLAAAQSDGAFVGSEAEEITRIIAEACGCDAPCDVPVDGKPIPEFDLRTECEALQISGDTHRAEREALFRLVARVVESDDVLDPTESRFLADVARFVKAGKHELEDLKGRGGWITSLPG